MGLKQYQVKVDMSELSQTKPRDALRHAQRVVNKGGHSLSVIN